MTDLFEDSPNEQKKADKLIKAGHFDIVNRSPLSLVFNEDCMQVMKRFSDGHFDLAIVDPPYGLNIAKTGSLGRDKFEAKDWDNAIPDDNYFDELFRVSKNQILWGANHYISKIPIDSSCWIVWNKVNGAGDFADCELAWTSFKTAVRKFTYYFGKENNERIHPTQKPKALYEWLLMKYAKEGNLILDTHLGSQSSRIAANKAGLDFVGFEIDREYYDNGNKRFKNFVSQGVLF